MKPSLIFFGSDQYSAVVLTTLLDNQKAGKLGNITVVTDRAKPKDKEVTGDPNPVEKMADAHALKVTYYPSNPGEMIKFISIVKNLYTNQVSIGLTASFPHLLPPALIDVFGGQLYNLHPSLLPQYRNVSPVPYTLAMGDSLAGISLFQIANGIDNGQIMAQVSLPVTPSHTTPSLLQELFVLGSNLFLKFLDSPSDPKLTDTIPLLRANELIFTRKITTDSGFIEWETLSKLLARKPIHIQETHNPLINLRLTHHPDRTHNILFDLVRALKGYDKVWSLVQTSKGELRITIESVTPPMVKIAGKPKPIPLADFKKYYTEFV